MSAEKERMQMEDYNCRLCNFSDDERDGIIVDDCDISAEVVQEEMNHSAIFDQV